MRSFQPSPKLQNSLKPNAKAFQTQALSASAVLRSSTAFFHHHKSTPQNASLLSIPKPMITSSQLNLPKYSNTSSQLFAKQAFAHRISYGIKHSFSVLNSVRTLGDRRNVQVRSLIPQPGQIARFGARRSFSFETGENKVFSKILIANRGEIACRIIKTARQMGVKTVAVYSEADANAMHFEMADEAYCIGPAASKDSYLRGDKLIEVAKLTGAEAIHPGYGFLSEKEGFAKMCEENGVVFIGPPASAIKDMGSKSASKDIMRKANVPLTPGYHGENQDPEHLKAEAKKIGYPVLIKAVLGGGGKGMKIVDKEEDFISQLESAKREALNSFSDDRVLIEKYLVDPRHIEFQVFGDKMGNYVYLFERDCSVQRRHQKVIEEAPAPHMSEDQRKSMGEAAVNAAKAVGYVGAGTVEFIVDSKTNEFYFMEMNTRLQVEHPITEMITGQDLVAWQIWVASGHPLPMTQEQLRIHGWAFEARIYAENPDNNFLPDTGKLVHLSTPEPSENVRVDTGVRQGDEVKIFYDPMIAKLVVWDKTPQGEVDRHADRLNSLQILAQALDHYKIVGPQNNVTFLKRLATHPEFQAGNVNTGFIEKHRSSLLPEPEKPTEKALALGALALLSHETLLNDKNQFLSLDLGSPFYFQNGKRLNYDYNRTITLIKGPFEEKLQVTYLSDTKFSVQFSSGKTSVMSFDPHSNRVVVDNLTFQPTLVVDEANANVTVFDNGTRTDFQIPVASFTAGAAAGSLLAPMPGKIIKVSAAPGDTVEKDQPLVIMEAMKMEHVIRATKGGVIKSINYHVGDTVSAKATLVEMEE